MKSLAHRKLRGLQKIRLSRYLDKKVSLQLLWDGRKRRKSWSLPRKRLDTNRRPLSTQVVLMLLLWKCKRYKYLFLGVFFIIYSLAVFLPDTETKQDEKCTDCLKILREKELSGWEQNKSRDIRVYVRPGEDTLMINSKLCINGDIDVMIVVCSAPDNFAQRNAIRETWGNHNYSNMQICFLLGTTPNASTQWLLNQESLQFGDLIQENFHDSYKNLTIKSVMMLKWFLRFCQSARYLMKTDDDMYINVTNLASVIESLYSPYVLFGSMIYDAKPVSDPKNKWYVPDYMYSEDIYPNYISGTGYLMSKRVAIKLYLASLTTPIVHIEDLYITGLCATKAGVTRKNHKSFSYEYYGPDCLPHHMVTSHKIPPEELYHIWYNRDNCSVYRLPAVTKSYLG